MLEQVDCRNDHNAEQDDGRTAFAMWGAQGVELLNADVDNLRWLGRAVGSAAQGHSAEEDGDDDDDEQFHRIQPFVISVG